MSIVLKFLGKAALCVAAGIIAIPVISEIVILLVVL